jgi:hypothetical protein
MARAVNAKQVSMRLSGSVLFEFLIIDFYLTFLFTRPLRAIAAGGD